MDKKKKKRNVFFRLGKLLFGMRRVSGVIVFIPRVPVVGQEDVNSSVPNEYFSKRSLFARRWRTLGVGNNNYRFNCSSSRI